MRHRATTFLAALALACATAPSPEAPPPRQTVLETVYDDRRVGRQASTDVAQEIGLVEDPELLAYVRETGRRVAARAPEQPFEYQFAIVDQWEPNAFALPGGFVYVSRGLLALASSGDELANVLGHEIAHVASRHAAARQEVARRQSVLLMPYLRMAQLAAYSREQESEADRAGQQLAADAGYDPAALARFLGKLDNVERLATGHTHLPSYFDTHPGAIERAASCAARAQQISWQRDPSRPGAYLERVDGLLLDENPAEGVFQGQRFLHPELDFQIVFPEGWRLENTRRAVGAKSPTGDALIFLTVEGPTGDPKLAADLFVAANGAELHLEVTRTLSLKIGHVDAYRLEARANMAGRNVGAQLTFVPHGDFMYRITGVAPLQSSDQYLGRARNAARSFRPLTPAERASIQAMRLRVVQAHAGEDLAELGRRGGNAFDTQRTAVLNGLFPNTRFGGGEPVKIARSEPYALEKPAADAAP